MSSDFKLSPLSSTLSGVFVTKEDIGRFVFLGNTYDGQCHFFILTAFTGVSVYLHVDTATRFDIVSNCSRYSLVTEIGVKVGSFFETEAAKTNIRTWHTLVNNSYYGTLLANADKSQNNMFVDDKVIGDTFDFDLSSVFSGCLLLTNKKGDVCLVSTSFNDERFHTIDLI